MNIDRPKAYEDVEDLEREQEKFLASRSRASVTLQKRPAAPETGYDPGVGSAEPRQKSRFRRERDEGRTQIPLSVNTSSTPPLLQNIVEKPGTAIYVPEVPKLEKSVESFPKATRRMVVANSTIAKGTADSKPSLFMQSLGPLAPPSVAQGLQTPEEIDREYEQIEKENQAKVSKMTPDEIADAQRELLARLDPKLVQFLREKRARPRTNVKKIITGGSQLDDAVLSDLMKPSPTPRDAPSTAEFVESELPLEPSAMAQYPGMTRVEKDKLAWMTLLPSPSAITNKKTDSDRALSENKRKAVFTCRFDLQGRILPADLDVPTQHALHHHGEEPERAGYTVQELMTLLASAVPSQRILALQVLANILNNHHSGNYDRCFPSGPELLESLLACGFVSLLRVSLDDQAASQVSEALKTTFALLVSPYDEACLDLIHSWVDEEPYMRPVLKVFGSKESTAEASRELTDEQLASCDIVRGLLRMDILARIRYLLEVCQPDTGAVGAALGSLIRIARHSPEAAERIAKCPRLCSFIVTEYLPMFGWNTPRLLHGKLASSGGIPLAQALKLIRVLCASSRLTAASLLVEHSLDRTIGIYLSIDVNEPKLPRREVLQLQLESLRLFRILLRHGLSADFFDNLSPVILRQLNFGQQVSLRPRTGDLQLFDLDYASCLMACTHARLKQIVSRDEDEWQAVASHTQAIVAIAVRWLNELCEEGELRITAMSTLAVALRFLADAHVHWPREVELNTVSTALRRLAEGPRWAALFDVMKVSSVLTMSFKADTGGFSSKRDVPALPSLYAIPFGTETVIPTVNERSPVFLLNSIAYLVWSAVQSNELEGAIDLGWRLLCADPLITYLTEVNSLPFQNLPVCLWFGREEVSLLYRIVRLRVALETKRVKQKDNVKAESLDMEIFRNAALTIIPLLSPDQSASISHLLKRVIFNRTCYSDISISRMANLSLKQQTPISASGEQVRTYTELLQEAMTGIDDILQTAEDMIYFMRGIIDARFLFGYYMTFWLQGTSSVQKFSVRVSIHNRSITLRLDVPATSTTIR
ncbi:RNA polymerase II-associated protein 1-like isoform X2 [Varroa destructor]|uniref:RNA polymerase II-associated protein 1 n=1 Tax=Varroa destructor TaxID=109461 RepID=A0A7M7KE20_VARDE|nr:RNA polymerase II-associated protein 1-like isoform X2 [Varroa destructor]